MYAEFLSFGICFRSGRGRVESERVGWIVGGKRDGLMR